MLAAEPAVSNGRRRDREARILANHRPGSATRRSTVTNPDCFHTPVSLILTARPRGTDPDGAVRHTRDVERSAPRFVVAASEGRYEAARAAALSGVPKSTLYYWPARWW